TWQTAGFPGVSDLHMDLSDRPPFVNTNGVSVSPLGLVISFSIIVFGLPLFFGSKAVCRYICPFAPFFRAADKIALFRLRAVNTSCDDCNECNRVCLMGIDVLGDLKRYGEVRDSQCIKCMTCVDACHTETIKWTWRSVNHWDVPRTEPKRSWYKRQAPFLVDVGLATLVVGVFALLPWDTITWVLGDGESFMLLVPLILFGGVLLRSTYLKWKKRNEPELVQIGNSSTGTKLPVLPVPQIPGGLPKKVQQHKRSRKWNSLGRGGD
ncbi:MAG: 4Fe-4S dicluster domain-containing protein, partial [Myxococcota bacterium]|nr:4Fe-4S dicluster domain-containing protein [Myxococcota bacterium]